MPAASPIRISRSVTQVAGPATTELLGHPSTFYSGLAVTVFLTGWAVGA